MEDVFPYLEKSPESFDVILVDLLDGYDETAVRLYDNVLGLTHKALAPGGVVGAFGDLAIPRMSIAPVYQGLTKLFQHVVLHRAAVQTFSGGYGFMLASNEVDFSTTPNESIVGRAEALTGELHALTPEAFPGCFALPAYIEAALRRPAPPPSSALADAFTWLDSK